MLNYFIRILNRCLILILLGAIFLGIFYTEIGLHLTVGLLRKVTPGKLNINELHGTLVGPITAKQIIYRQADWQIEGHDLNLTWRLADLILGKISLSSLTANEIDFRFLPTTKKLIDQHRFPNLRFFDYALFRYDLQHVELHNVHYISVPLSKPVTIKTLSLSAQGSFKKLKQFTLQAEATHSQIKLQVALRPKLNVNWQIKSNDLGDFNTQLKGNLFSDGYFLVNAQRHPESKINLQLNNFKLTPRVQISGGSPREGGVAPPLTEKQLNYQQFSLVKLVGKFDLAATNSIGHFAGEIQRLILPNYSIPQLNFNSLIKINASQKTFLPMAITSNFASFSLISTDDINLPNLNFAKITTDTLITTKDVTTQFNIYPTRESPITGNFSVDYAKKIAGKINWQSKKFNLLNESISMQLPKVTTDVDLSLQLFGTLEMPNWLGQVHLQNLVAYFPLLNLQLDKSYLNLKFDKNKIDYQGRMASLDKVLTIEGTTKLLPSNRHLTEFKISGNDFLLSNTKAVQLWISPKLKVILDSEKIDVNGEIYVPRANLDFQTITGVETLPRETVFVDQNFNRPTKVGLPLEFRSKINLYLGDEVNFQAMDMLGKLDGSLVIENQPNESTTATGFLFIKNGTYTIHSQRLKISKGSLIFSHSAIDNPNLDIQALRKISTDNINSSLFNLENKDIIVGMNIHGKLDNPTATLFSDPANLAQEDILGYLVVGQAGRDLDKNKFGLVLDAVRSLPLGRGINKLMHVTDTLREKLGLSELSVQTGVVSQQNDQYADEKEGNSGNGQAFTTSLMLGKYLNPKLYVGYSINLSNEVNNAVKVRYNLTKSFILQTESNFVSSGIDLLYSIIRN